MTIPKKEIQQAITALGGKPLFTGNDRYLLHDVVINTADIESLSGLIKVVFAMGMDYKIREIKRAMEIVDPRF